MPESGPLRILRIGCSKTPEYALNTPHFQNLLLSTFPNGEWQLNVRDDGERGSASPLTFRVHLDMRH